MSKAIIIASLLLVLGLITFSCGVYDPDLLPARPDGPHFDHEAHLLRHARECKSCHGEEDVEWNGMPDLKSCMVCHEKLDKDKPVEKTPAAFYNEAGEGRWAHVMALDDEKIFDHKKHVAKVEDCLTCHLMVAQSKSVPVGAAMPMERCQDCHQKDLPEKNDCEHCHKENRPDRRPLSHNPGFLRDHGRSGLAFGDEDMAKDCVRCHSANACDDCHQAEPPRSHTNLWRLYGHGPMAYLNRESCAVCHKTDSCATCHQASKPRSHRGGAWGLPFLKHCNGCHLPLEQYGGEECAECHKWNPSHAAAPPRPPSAPHMLGGMPDPMICRTCHNAPLSLSHPDNGDSCLLCHE